MPVSSDLLHSFLCRKNVIVCSHFNIKVHVVESYSGDN